MRGALLPLHWLTDTKPSTVVCAVCMKSYVLLSAAVCSEQ